jgi:phosphoglycolate phosphatase
MHIELSRYRYILWDWNGTLLDDAWLCVDVMNTILREYGLPVRTLDSYKEIFDFPVRDYYLKLGFNFDEVPFEVVGMEFMDRYNDRHFEASLHPEVREVLTVANEKGYKQMILSAREQTDLVAEIRKFSLEHYFSGIYGLDDHYAHGKTDVGIRLLTESQVPKEQVIFIGDTRHDAEVAAEIGVDCILIPNGHHTRERLMQCGVPVINTLNDIIKML